MDNVTSVWPGCKVRRRYINEVATVFATGPNNAVIANEQGTFATVSYETLRSDYVTVPA